MIYPNLPWNFFWVVSWFFSKFMRIFHHFESNCSFQTALVRPWCFRAKGWWLDHRQWWDGGDGGDGASPQVGWHVIYQQDIRGCRFVPHFFFAEIYPPQMVKGDLDIIYIIAFQGLALNLQPWDTICNHGSKNWLKTIRYNYSVVTGARTPLIDNLHL